MDIQLIQRIASLLSKDYAEEMLRLLTVYRGLSASEAAARLDLHIKTAQDFLEGLHAGGFLERDEVMEGKRPFFRYRLVTNRIGVSIDVSTLKPSVDEDDLLDKRIREKKNAPAFFTAAADPKRLASVTLVSGKGRNKKERRINLTDTQGRLLYYLPFPTESAVPVKNLLQKAELSDESLPEALDIIRFLAARGVVETA